MSQEHLIHQASADAVAEVFKAIGMWPGFNSAHEGFAVLKEEVDELWVHVKTNQKKRDLIAMRKEAIQVAAMALRFASEVCGEELGRKMKPLYKIGEVVRYDSGPTALMRIETISLNHGGQGWHRYYGVQFYGSSEGRYENQLQKATPAEIQRFENDDHIGRLRDYRKRLVPDSQSESGEGDE